MDKLVLVRSMKHKENLNVHYNNEIFYGANQKWYNESTRIFGGCGPICVYNLLNYNQRSSRFKMKQSLSFGQELKNFDKICCDTIYQEMKPTEIHRIIPNFLLDKELLPPTLGVKSLRQFKKNFMLLSDHLIESHITAIYEYRFNNALPNTIDTGIAFIEQSLKKNIPICFLNAFVETSLYMKDKNVQSRDYNLEVMEKHNFITHWVLITGLYKSEVSDDYYLECSSWGQIGFFKLNDFYKPLNLKGKLFQSGMLTFVFDFSC